ncbi:hypothetical protein ANCDUO_00703 [Ancylostoma duodenale]|uniref:G-protein coupled receptors family 1 profile domain-containing protein n=1 Tax=Ancylostoma duodenale TaxID=51022 RepID=A0A0C2H545_9BILA|nr:hypothetical protein ANCDUO_00703 [Ancylostoma duodenale]
MNSLSVIIAMTVAGNTMVVVAVFSYRPLKKVQNYFLVSLAASDLAVAIFVMPLHSSASAFAPSRNPWATTVAKMTRFMNNSFWPRLYFAFFRPVNEEPTIGRSSVITNDCSN